MLALYHVTIRKGCTAYHPYSTPFGVIRSAELQLLVLCLYLTVSSTCTVVTLLLVPVRVRGTFLRGFLLSDSAWMSSFECSVCLRLLHEPATLPCGHSFCRRCLIQCLDHDLRCPSCRVDVPVEAANCQVNVTLAEALQMLFPSEAAERTTEMKDTPIVIHEGLQSFPLFVLEPLMPGQTMNLHVFEPRYIRLTQRALTEPRLQRSFGMIAPQHRHSNGLATHGTSAVIIHSSDAGGGRFYLTVKGGRRFKVLRTWDVDGYRNAAITWAHDAPSVASTDSTSAGDVALRNTLLAREVRPPTSTALDNTISPLTLPSPSPLARRRPRTLAPSGARASQALALRGAVGMGEAQGPGRQPAAQYGADAARDGAGGVGAVGYGCDQSAAAPWRGA